MATPYRQGLDLFINGTHRAIKIKETNTRETVGKLILVRMNGFRVSPIIGWCFDVNH